MYRFCAPASSAIALVLCSLLFAWFPSAAEAQVLYGSIVGNVRDSTGAAVIGASVTITHNTNFIVQQGFRRSSSHAVKNDR